MVKYILITSNFIILHIKNCIKNGFFTFVYVSHNANKDTIFIPVILCICYSVISSVNTSKQDTVIAI